MKTSLVQIGNSRGVRIPKSVLEQTGLRDEVEMVVRGLQIVLRAPKNPREGWDRAFERMAEAGDDALLDADIGPLTAWDEAEWEW